MDRGLRPPRPGRGSGKGRSRAGNSMRAISPLPFQEEIAGNRVIVSRPPRPKRHLHAPNQGKIVDFSYQALRSGPRYAIISLVDGTAVFHSAQCVVGGRRGSKAPNIFTAWRSRLAWSRVCAWKSERSAGKPHNHSWRSRLAWSRARDWKSGRSTGKLHNYSWRSRLAWSRACDWKSHRRQKRLEGSNPSSSATAPKTQCFRGFPYPNIFQSSA